VALSQLQRDAGIANMLLISYHASDPFSNIDGNIRLSYYSVLGEPTTLADGVLRLVGSYDNVRQDSAAFAGFYNQRHAVSSPLSITVTGRYNTSTHAGRVKATITNTGSTALLSRRLRYVIVETVPYNWQWTDTCWQVCRKMPTYPSGVTLSLNPGETKADSQNFTIDTTWVESRIRLVAFVQNDSTKEIHQAAWVPLSSFTGVEGGAPAEPVGSGVVLAQNRPNPAKGSTEIAFSLPKAENVRLSVYDAQGRLVRNLAEGVLPAGTHNVTVSGLESGVYFYRLEAGKTSLTRRMVVAK
jgi:hypothetical protein